MAFIFTVIALWILSGAVLLHAPVSPGILRAAPPSITRPEEKASDCFDVLETILFPWLEAYSTQENITLYVCYSQISCVSNGDVIHANQTATIPYVSLTGSSLNENHTYTYMLLDVDNFTRRKPMARSTLHWLVTSIPGSISPFEHVADIGKVLVPYTPAHEPYSFEGYMGTHRYYSLLFTEDKNFGNIDGLPWFEQLDVHSFDVQNFAARHGLGFPVTGRMHRVQYPKSDRGSEDLQT